MEPGTNVWIKNDIVIIDLSGDITTLAEEKLQQAYLLASRQESSGIIFNFEQVRYINSSGIAILMNYLLEDNKQRYAFVGLSSHYQKVFRMVGLADYANFYDSKEKKPLNLGSKLLKMSVELTTKLVFNEKAAVLEFSGDLTGLSESQVYETYEKIGKGLVQNIILNFARTGYISSSGIAVIINILKRAGENKHKVYITNLNSHYQKIFQMVGVNRYVQTYNTDEEAIARM